VHPTRLRRVESFSFAIPALLGHEAARFIEEARVAADARAAAEVHAGCCGGLAGSSVHGAQQGWL
jgi:hypothetical protein